MIVYEGTKREFVDDAADEVIADTIKDNLYKKTGRSVSSQEFKAWENSMLFMYRVLNDNSIPENSGIAIEYNIPQTSKRVDFIISGYDSSNNNSAIVVELKQWSELSAVRNSNTLVETFTGGALRRVVHPSYQAWSYCSLIKDYNTAVQDNVISLKPCVYMHNYELKAEDPVLSDQYAEFLIEAPVYTKGHIRDLKDFIHKHIAKGDDKETLYLIENGKIRPSKSLQNEILSMLKGNKEFIMIDEQEVVYQLILSLSKKCQEDKKKRTVIVKGGPGTGKTVIAINLLSALTNDGQLAQYASKNAAPRQVYLQKLKGHIKKSTVDNMFKGSGNYVDVDLNEIDTIICDEAHRLNDKSGMFHNLGENQIKEIIHSSYCSVFFIDESQRVTTNDIGSCDEIKYWAAIEKSEVIETELVSQFRCNGSDGYLAWLDNVLEIRETANYNLEGIDYDIRIFDDPKTMYDEVVKRNNENHNSRLLSGYCWDWPKENRKNTEYHDIKIGDFGISWNLDGDVFATEDSSISEAGCIHTTQGLEFDYAGLIIGDDLRYENGKVITDFTKRAKTDQSLKGIKKLYKENPDKALKLADEIIKNTYRVLMTRGMKGCYVYCTDANLRDYLKERIKQQ